MAEAAAETAARPLACPAAAPRRHVRLAARPPQRTHGLRCRSSQDGKSSAAGTSSRTSTSSLNRGSISRSSIGSTPMDVLRNDFSYLEGRTGLDLLTPLEAVAEAHDEVRCPCCACYLIPLLCALSHCFGLLPMAKAAPRVA